MVSKSYQYQFFTTKWGYLLNFNLKFHSVKMILPNKYFKLGLGLSWSKISSIFNFLPPKLKNSILASFWRDLSKSLKLLLISKKKYSKYSSESYKIISNVFFAQNDFEKKVDGVLQKLRDILVKRGPIKKKTPIYMWFWAYFFSSFRQKC